jgi:hypothetical protein
MIELSVGLYLPWGGLTAAAGCGLRFHADAEDGGSFASRQIFFWLRTKQ